MEGRPRSRRSNLDLSKLSIAPLSRDPSYPTQDDGAHDGTYHHRSYMENRSTPATPGILSRSSSHSRRPGSSSGSATNLYAKAGLSSSKSFANLDFANYDNLYDDNSSGGSRTPRSHIPKSRSTTQLYPGVGGALTSLTPKDKKSRHRKAKSTHAEEGLLYRLGSAIAISNREEKGQSWLLSRDSSTSLAAQNREDGPPPESVRTTGNTPAHSRVGSRRGSRARLDAMAGLTPFAGGPRTPRHGGPRTPGGTSRRSTELVGGERLDYFGSAATRSLSTAEAAAAAANIPGPDFVSAQDRAELLAAELRARDVAVEDSSDDDGGDFSDDSDAAADDEEVARLAKGQSFGLGGFIDRLVGWSFDARDEEDDDDARETARKHEARRRRKERSLADAVSTPAPAPVVEAKKKAQPETQENKEEAGEGGWSDAAWLLSVASKALFA